MYFKHRTNILVFDFTKNAKTLVNYNDFINILNEIF